MTLVCNHFALLFQIYIGRYIAPRNKENPGERNDAFLEGLGVENFGVVFLSNCDEEPVIGVVKEVTEVHFKIHYWTARDLQGKMVSIKLAKINRALDTNTSKGMYHICNCFWSFFSLHLYINIVVHKFDLLLAWSILIDRARYRILSFVLCLSQVIDAF